MAHDLQDFERDVLQRSREVPVLVDFWAPWCGPCMAFGPVLEGLAARAEGRWDLIKINADIEPGLSAQFGVRALPTVKLFVDGEVAAGFAGMKAENEILEFLEPFLPSPERERLREAERLLEAGDAAGAVRILEALPEKKSAAWFTLAKACLGTEPGRVAEAVQRISIGAAEADAAKALLELAAVIQSAPTIPALPGRDLYLKGVAELGHLDFDGALTSWIELMEQHPGFASGTAVEACKAVFRFLGIRHPVAEKHHRRFSSLAFS